MYQIIIVYIKKILRKYSQKSNTRSLAIFLIVYKSINYIYNVRNIILKGLEISLTSNKRLEAITESTHTHGSNRYNYLTLFFVQRDISLLENMDTLQNTVYTTTLYTCMLM